MPRIFSDHMVIQRDQKIKIWGWSDRHEKVEVIILNQSKSTVANEKGYWFVTFNKLKSNSPFSIFIKGKNELELKDVVLGDVYLCSGQSNMELAFNRLKYKYPDEVVNAYNPNIRQFQVPDGYNFKEENVDYTSGEWLEVNPKNIFVFSGVAYFFAKKIFEKTNVPVGLVNCAYGGSSAIAWIDEATVKTKYNEIYQEYVHLKDDEVLNDIIKTEKAERNLWTSEINKFDAGIGYQWLKSDGTDKWKKIVLPNSFNDVGIHNFNGMIYFKKEIYIEDPEDFDNAKLELGRIIDADSTFINGNFIGNITYQYPPRRYHLAKNYFKKGKNIITVKVLVQYGNGAFVKGRKYELTTPHDTIDLAGAWVFKIGYKMSSPVPASTSFNNKPFGVFNHMFAPIQDFTFKGVLWYQGESNVSTAQNYGDLMANLIEVWRNKLGNKKLPFFCVQLPLFGDAEIYKHSSEWATLRNEQYKISKVDGVELVTVLDLGETNDIHPERKQEVGDRLAYKALPILYGYKVEVPKFPKLAKWKMHKDKIELQFENLDLSDIGEDVLRNQFYFIDKQGRHVPATVYKNKNNLILTCIDFTMQYCVRYAWADNPLFANLINKKGLPLSPLSIDLKKN